MKRFSVERTEHIEYAFWLTFSRDGDVRMSRGEPSVARGERAMSCIAQLPKSLFKIPELRASIRVGDRDPGTFQIDVESVSEALKLAIGTDIDLRVTTERAEDDGRS